VIDLEDIYPLSPMQKGMLFHSLLSPETGVYFEQISWRLRGELNAEALRQAWQQVTDRNPVLRTSFDWEQLDRPMQLVHRRVEVPWEQQDWRRLSEREQSIRLQTLLEGDRRRGFALGSPPLFRLALLRLAENEHCLVWSHHHLLLDGWSSSLLLAEVFPCYQEFCQGRLPNLLPVRPYRDYIAWLQRQDLARAEAFWRQMLQGFQTPTRLRLERASVKTLDAEAEDADEEVYLSRQTTEQLQAVAQRERLTLHTFAQGAWAVLLSRYSGETDIVFGTTVSGRSPDVPGVESMIGLFINTLPTRIRVPSDQTVISWLRQLQDQQAEAREYDYAPLSDIQDWSDLPRDTPLFETLFVFENEALDRALNQQRAGRVKDGLELREIRAFGRTNYPLTAVVAPGPRLFLGLSYDWRRFDGVAIRRMLGHWQTLLEGMAARPNAQLRDVPMLTDAERRTLLVEWNRTEADFPRDRCIHELFAEQAAQTPHALAVVAADQQLTYSKLEQRANQLANALRLKGVRPEVRVGVCLERSPDLIVGLLGVLKAGGAYVPLDPSYPEERLSLLLRESRPAALLTQSSLRQRLPQDLGETLLLDIEQLADDNTCPVVAVGADNLAYVMYTSGSTGQPKGVMISHRAVCNHLRWSQAINPLTANDRVLQMAPYSFDASVWEIFGSLLAGASLVLAAEGPQSLTELVRLLDEQQITVAVFVPSVLQALLDEGGLERCQKLRRVDCGGEALSASLRDRFFRSLRATLHNCYGPTEACIDATYFGCRPDAAGSVVPIGRPIANAQAYVLNASLQLDPIGVSGDLYLAGTGLARGYADAPDVTAEKFIPNPFAAEPGSRLYRTGDLACWLLDGNLKFLGRSDYQVKMHGCRVELGEIEATLTEFPGVNFAVVLAREDVPGDKRLAAYIEPSPHAALDLAEIRNFLAERLPEPMRPASFVILDALPLTPSGKLDRRALPAPSAKPAALQESFVLPNDAVEEVLVGIWSEVLKVERVGVHDDFFELGGDSLLSLRIVGRIRSTLQVEMPLRTLFDAPTVAGVAAALRQDAAKGAEMDRIAELILSLAHLTEDEVQAMLAARAS
jgi:amino acid adenylation domain-containing protein